MFQQFGFLEILTIAGFIVLVLGFIVLFRLAGIVKASANKNAPVNKETVPHAQIPAVKPTGHTPTAQNAQAPSAKKDDLALIAVLTAAAAVYMDTAPNGLHIKSYRRLKNGKPSWNKAGRHDIMRNHI